MASLWQGVIPEYADRLPMLHAAPTVTLQEGGTPLIEASEDGTVAETVGGHLHGHRLGNTATEVVHRGKQRGRFGRCRQRHVRGHGRSGHGSGEREDRE